ncbi:MAG: HNH nuclease family protein [Nitrospinae bacterium]|nr:HNH nuclease family protein [Nitrospinota bacterium]
MKTQSEDAKIDPFVAGVRREIERRKKEYRARALKIFPWICGRCGREFSGKKLRELTVHHKDHNHENNPPDGSNWELLCIYCHDNEHSRNSVAEWYAEPTPGGEKDPPYTYKPFEGLDALLKGKK